MATPHDVTLKAWWLFNSWGWGRGTWKSLYLRNKTVTQCWKVVSSFVSERVSFEILGWMRHLSERCEQPSGLSRQPEASLDTASQPPTMAPEVSVKGMKMKQLKMDTCFRMCFVAEAKAFNSFRFEFPHLFPVCDSFLKHTALPYLLLPGSPMDWQIFRGVKVKRGSTWSPASVFLLAFFFVCPRRNSRKWNHSVGPTAGPTSPSVLLIKAWSLALLSCGVLSVAVATH